MPVLVGVFKIKLYVILKELKLISNLADIYDFALSLYLIYNSWKRILYLQHSRFMIL